MKCLTLDNNVTFDSQPTISLGRELQGSRLRHSRDDRRGRLRAPGRGCATRSVSEAARFLCKSERQDLAMAERIFNELAENGSVDWCA